MGPGIQALATDRGVDLIVLGSPHHGPIGRVLLGSTAETVVAGAPCAVAIAPRRFRRRAALEPAGDRRGVRRLVRVGRGARRRRGPRARRGRAPARDRRRAVGLEPADPASGSGVAAELARACAELPDDIEVESVVLHGDPAHKLKEETERLGLLVCGSRARGPLRRVMLGSVSSAVIRSAACPVVVVPRRALEPRDALQSRAPVALHN